VAFGFIRNKVLAFLFFNVPVKAAELPEPRLECFYTLHHDGAWQHQCNGLPSKLR